MESSWCGCWSGCWCGCRSEERGAQERRAAASGSGRATVTRCELHCNLNRTWPISLSRSPSLLLHIATQPPPTLPMEREHDITRSRRRMRPPGGGSTAAASLESSGDSAAASASSTTGTSSTPPAAAAPAPITPSPAMFSRTLSMEYKNFFVRSKTSERLFSQSGSCWQSPSAPRSPARPLARSMLTADCASQASRTTALPAPRPRPRPNRSGWPSSLPEEMPPYV